MSDAIHTIESSGPGGPEGGPTPGAESVSWDVEHRLRERVKMMGKLDLHSVAELTKYAVREGLTTLN